MLVRMSDRLRANARTTAVTLPMVTFVGRAVILEEWLELLFAGVTFAAGAVFWLRFRGTSRSEVAEFLEGQGAARVSLSYSSVPEPWSGRKLLPLMTRSSPGLPMHMSVVDGDLVLDKRRDISSGRNRFEMGFPLDRPGSHRRLEGIECTGGCTHRSDACGFVAD